MDETSRPASDPISPLTGNESTKAGGDAVIVNNDAPEYSTRLESDGNGDGGTTGWRAMFVNGHPAVLNYRYLTTLSFLLTVISVCGMIFGRVREEGIYADEYLWMRYQVRHQHVESRGMSYVMVGIRSWIKTVSCML